METLFKKIVEWHINAFPEILPEKQKEKLAEEKLEFALATTLQEKLEELADIYIVNAGLSRFFPEESRENVVQIREDMLSLNLSLEALKQAIEKKLEENKKRVWYIASGEYHHVERDDE